MGLNLLHRACLRPCDYQLQVMEKLLRHGADVNLPDARGRSPLQILIETANANDRLVTLLFLLARWGAYLDKPFTNGQLPSQVFCDSHWNGKDERQQMSFLDAYAPCAHHIAPLLYDAKKKSLARSTNGQPLLHALLDPGSYSEKLSGYKRYHWIHELCEVANVDERAPDGDTILHFLAKKQPTNCTYVGRMILLGTMAKKTRNLDALDQREQTALQLLLQHAAACSDSHAHRHALACAACALVSRGADPFLGGSLSPVCLAASLTHQDTEINSPLKMILSAFLHCYTQSPSNTDVFPWIERWWQTYKGGDWRIYRQLTLSLRSNHGDLRGRPHRVFSVAMGLLCEHFILNTKLDWKYMLGSF